MLGVISINIDVFASVQNIHVWEEVGDSLKNGWFPYTFNILSSFLSFWEQFWALKKSWCVHFWITSRCRPTWDDIDSCLLLAMQSNILRAKGGLKSMFCTFVKMLIFLDGKILANRLKTILPRDYQRWSNWIFKRLIYRTKHTSFRRYNVLYYSAKGTRYYLIYWFWESLWLCQLECFV